MVLDLALVLIEPGLKILLHHRGQFAASAHLHLTRDARRLDDAGTLHLQPAVHCFERDERLPAENCHAVLDGGIEPLNILG